MSLINMSDYNGAAKCYWLALTAAGAVACAWAASSLLALGPMGWAQFVALASFVVVSAARPVRIPGTKASVTAGDCFIFLGVIFLGVPAGVLLGALDLFVSAVRTTRRGTSWVAAPACMAVTVFASGHIFYFALAAHAGVGRRPVGLGAALDLRQLLLPLAAMALAQYALNSALVAALHALKGRRPVWRVWREGYLWTWLTFLAGASAALFVYLATMRFGALYVVMCVPVVAATLATYRAFFERVAEKTREAAEMSRLHLATVEALAAAIDAKDQTTHCHVRRVQIYCARVGELLGLTAGEIEALRAGALLHDVGKLAVPDHILNKPGRLDDAEFEKMKVHASVGAQIIERVGFPYPVTPIVRSHHERWDGRGYPDGLRGEEIPLTARVLAVADCFDSVREDRPHRRGMTREEACELIRRKAGTHFDPRVVEIFLRHQPEFEREIAAQGIGHSGVATSAPDHRELLEEAGAAPRHESREPHEPRGGDARRRAPGYLNQISSAHREVYALFEIARTFGSSLDIEDTVSVLVDKVGHIVPFDLCAVYLHDELKGRATAAHVAGLHAGLLRGRAVAPGEGVVGFVLANRRASHLLDPMLDFGGVALPEGCVYRSMAALPLFKDGRALGVLAVYSHEPGRYTDDHLRLLDTVARLASDALSNAVQHAAAESNALTDTLTGLPNARALRARFDEEAARARRTGRPFQVVMLDLDDFKLVNDTYGHQTGDRVLREVGQLILAQLREYDFLARYAGDEFVAVVQDLDAEQVAELRGRIGRAVTGFSLHVRGDQRARVGVSAGAAAWGVQGETLDQLLVAADEAMYSAKSDNKRRSTGPHPALPPAPNANTHTSADLATGDLASPSVN